MQKHPMHRLTLISPQEAWSIRQPVLREGKPIESCIFEGDASETTYHVGLFKDKQLIAVASFMKHAHTLFLETNQFQLRGMAVLKAFQGQGYGQQILNYGESHLIKQGVNIVWCHARQIAVPFYQKNKYTIQGDAFIIPEIGIHYVMNKSL